MKKSTLSLLALSASLLFNCSNPDQTTEIDCTDPAHTPQNCPTCAEKNHDQQACAMATSNCVDEMFLAAADRCGQKGCGLAYDHMTQAIPKLSGTFLSSWGNRNGKIHEGPGTSIPYSILITDSNSGKKYYPCFNDSDRQAAMSAALQELDRIHGY